MKKMAFENLIQEAICAKEFSYAPYSNFHVGAALLAEDGRIFRGCNVENSAYSPSICAERTAVAKAVSEGAKNFSAIAIVGDGNQYLPPCGVCRQVLSEFCDSEKFKIILAIDEKKYQIFTLKDLFPSSFGKENIMTEFNS